MFSSFAFTVALRLYKVYGKHDNKTVIIIIIIIIVVPKRLSELVVVEYPSLAAAVEAVRLPLILEQIEPLSAEVQGPAAPGGTTRAFRGKPGLSGVGEFSREQGGKTTRYVRG